MCACAYGQTGCRLGLANLNPNPNPNPNYYLVVVVRVRVRTDRLQPQRMMHHAHRLREGRRALLRHSAVLCGTVPRRALLCAAFTTALITAVPRRALGVGELVVLEQ